MKKLLLSLTLSASLLVTPALAAEAVTFTDVAADAWYAPYVEACAEDGLNCGLPKRSPFQSPWRSWACRSFPCSPSAR